MPNHFDSLILVALTAITTTSIIYALLLQRFLEQQSIRSRHDFQMLQTEAKANQWTLLRRLTRLDEAVEQLKMGDDDKRRERENQVRWSDPDNNGWGEQVAGDWFADAPEDVAEEEAEEEIEEEKKPVNVGKQIVEAALAMYWARIFSPDDTVI